MTRERRMDLAGIGIITILTLMGFYFSVFTQSSFTGEGFLFGILYFFFYKAVNRKTFEGMHFSIRGVRRWLRQPKIWLWILAGGDQSAADFCCLTYVSVVLQRNHSG